MGKYWLDYVKHCYDLVVESEHTTRLALEHDIEAYVVHLMAKNFERTDIGSAAIAPQLLAATRHGGQGDKLVAVADECLLIHSFPFRMSKWPTPTYYQEMGITAYGLANHYMERHFIPASRIITAIFNQK